MELALSSTDSRGLLSVLDILKAQGVNVESYAISDGKLHLTLRLKLRNHLDALRKLLTALDGFKIEAMN